MRFRNLIIRNPGHYESNHSQMPIKLHCKSVLCGLISSTSAPLYNLQLGRGYIGDDSLEATVTNAIVQDPPRPRFSLLSLSLSLSLSLHFSLSIRRSPPRTEFSSTRRRISPRGGFTILAQGLKGTRKSRLFAGNDNSSSTTP